MPHAIRFYETGSPEVLRWEAVDVGHPGKGEVRVRHTAVGLNFIDVYHRSGLYPVQLPATPGLEACGVVEEVGEGVDDLKPGDRVAYASPPMGAYAQVRLMPADRLVKVPEGVSDEQAASMMLKGMTAEYLIRRTFPVKAEHTILVHAAAGGVGLILCQWAKALGATVIGTVGSDEKARLAEAHGCDYPIVYTREDFVTRVMEITGGRKCDVVYDSVGRDTFMKSLECVRMFGLVVSFGQSSGPVPPFEVGVLSAKGSLYLTRPTLMHYTAKREDLVMSADALFQMVLDGKIRINVNQTYPLREAAQAHRDLEARKTTGSTVFVV
ncbi:quinone oxidoreductase family protein [Pelomicrobium methylotrophicum]|uniref:Quinone oxidoreductase n=1 Tax=Pelomicrobium methylotrophicum TaxID=2602750 RepID=A0A5C7EVE4_9PROT|nr:quinone oxidoreductase [Pelomicrobium methylotrophicum]TXF12281.1 quinone oxidoreductase [Pelomicrobium methylotrophicum]